jgi:hypothetical protein
MAPLSAPSRIAAGVAAAIGEASAHFERSIELFEAQSVAHPAARDAARDRSDGDLHSAQSKAVALGQSGRSSLAWPPLRFEFVYGPVRGATNCSRQTTAGSLLE